MKLFDGHCDTAYELWTRGEGLERNSCHIDLQKAAGLAVGCLAHRTWSAENVTMWTCRLH